MVCQVWQFIWLLLQSEMYIAQYTSKYSSFFFRLLNYRKYERIVFHFDVSLKNYPRCLICLLRQLPVSTIVVTIYRSNLKQYWDLSIRVFRWVVTMSINSRLSFYKYINLDQTVMKVSTEIENVPSRFNSYNPAILFDYSTIVRFCCSTRFLAKGLHLEEGRSS